MGFAEGAQPALDQGRVGQDPAVQGGGACVSTRKADSELHRLRLQSAGTTRYQLRRGDTIRDGPSKIPGGEYLLTAVDPQGAVSGLVGPVREEKYHGQRQAHDLPV